MATAVEGTPRCTAEQARDVLREWFGIQGEIQSLPSERDQNFLVTSTTAGRLVFKIANAGETADSLDFQNKAIAHVARCETMLRLPTVVPTVAGDELARIVLDDRRSHFARLLTFVPGVLWAEVRPHGDDLLRSLGRKLAEMGHALASFTHPAMSRVCEWDLKHASNARAELGRVPDRPRRDLLERVLDRVDVRVVPRASRLRTSVIHGDWNDYNVLVSEDVAAQPREVVGAIDFGDLVQSYTIGDLAIALAYALMGTADPIAAAAQIVCGYHERWAIPEEELDLLLDLVQARLCMSAVAAFRNLEAAPDNPYLQISQKPVWALLQQLDATDPAWGRAVLRDACGLPASARTAPVLEWLAAHRAALAPVAAALTPFRSSPSASEPTRLDLSVESSSAPDLTMLTSGDAARAQLAAAGFGESSDVSVAIGRYAEARVTDDGPACVVRGNDGDRVGTIHLGVDLFLSPGSTVHAPLDGVVKRVHVERSPSAERATVVLEHRPDAGIGPFFTLVRNLAAEAADLIAQGSTVAAGQSLGTTLAASDTGWPSHVHVQLLTEPLADAAVCPTLAAPSQRRIWQGLCPNPSALLGLSVDVAAAPPSGERALLARRHRHISPALSVSYRRPIAMVRGHRQYLFDDEARRFLDGVNNVAHVGHSHPAVVRAASEQLARLNTNTRYPHEKLSEYAERLCALLPEPLRVCFLVCSGSEANELALRLARTHTRREGIVSIDAAYHGNTAALIDISAYKFNGPGGRGCPPHVRTIPLPDGYRGRHRADDPGAGVSYARYLDGAIASLRDEGYDLAAFIGESLPGCGGQVVPPAGYFAEAYRLTREAGGVCIADEVQVGFGRVGTHFWGFETQGVVPDIVTMGKPIGNGFPLGAVVTTSEIAASFDNGMEYFNTFGGNPVACAAGLAVLDVMRDEGLQAHANRVGASGMKDLRALQRRHAIIGDVRGMGLFIGLECVESPSLTPAPHQASYIVNRLRDRGILLSTDGPDHNVIKLKPPLVFDQQDATRLVETLDDILAEDAARARSEGAQPETRTAI